MTGYVLSLLTQTLLFAAMASSYNLLIGFGRLFSIAQGAFIGLGAYAVGAGVVNFGWPPLPALALGVVAGGAVGLFLGAVALRVADDYLAIATFAFQILFTTALTNLKEITSGGYGIPGVPPLSIAGVVVSSRPAQLGVALVILLLALEVTRRLGSSPFGRILRAAGEDEVATRALGKRTRQAKVAIFAISGALAALSGGVYASFVGFIIPEMFNIHFSMLLLSMVIIGGAGSITGPVAGAALMVLLPELLNFVGVTDNRVSYVRQALFGGALLLVVVSFQRGLVRPRPFGGLGTSPETAAQHQASPLVPVEIQCRELQKRFGGVVAVDSVTTTLAAGRVTGVVGPNGAGKTTLFDLMTGFERPDAGAVSMGPVRFDAEGPDARCRRGLVRSFQNLRLFPRLTVLENVMVGVPLGWAEGAGSALLRRRRVRAAEAEAAAVARAVLATVGLTAGLDRESAELSYAEQKLLSLARVLATRPRAILLDEPASGLDPRTLGRMATLVREQAREGRTVCVVEHNTQVLAEMADHMVFLHLGQVRAEGSPREILADPELAAIYFGVEPGKA